MKNATRSPACGLSRSALISGCSLCFLAGSALANPTVNGTTISWPDDGWYQVQSVDGVDTICSGGRSCEVSPGTYLIINHTTGQRFSDVTVSDTLVPEPTGVVVSGGTISWPDDGWYQVQTAGGSRSICNGGSFCDVEPGEYLVINHTSGERFDDILVGDSTPVAPAPGVASVTVDGATIRWPDNGWYQVQDSESFVSICEGGLSCEVVPGSYFVINHTSGTRQTVAVEGAGGGTAPPAETATVQVNFEITVPFIVSNALQVQLSWGETRLTAAWLIDESWAVAGELAADTEQPLSITFFDDNGGIVLATAETLFRTSSVDQDFQITADQFDSERWDSDGDGTSNLDELRVGRDPYVLDETDPTGPTQVTALDITTYSGFDLELFWPRASDDVVVVGYDIYRNGEVLVSMLDALSYYDPTTEPEREYVYTIYAVDNDGFRSLPTSATALTPADQPVTGVSAQYASVSGGESNKAIWTISDGLTTTNGSPTGGSCTTRGGAGSGIGVSDGSLISESGSRQGDAFDNASLLWINGEQVGGFLRAASESTSNYATVPLSGLEVTVEYHSVSTSPTLRNYTTLRNDTGGDIFAVVNFVSNFGSDSGTIVHTTSSGDTTIGVDDRWIITDDFSPSAGDPANTLVLFGPGSPRSEVVFVEQTVFDCWTRDGVNARMDVVIPAGAQRSLMFFHQLSDSSTEADLQALQFETTPAVGSPLVEGLSAAQLSEIVNWDY